ncbi:hypothetical protein AcV7_000056 [Taiwanofungus camphoratus]|nr:hypothetical protein AcV7_000056 [Antrodia cinnamomea]
MAASTRISRSLGFPAIRATGPGEGLRLGHTAPAPIPAWLRAGTVISKYFMHTAGGTGRARRSCAVCLAEKGPAERPDVYGGAALSAIAGSAAGGVFDGSGEARGVGSPGSGRAVGGGGSPEPAARLLGCAGRARGAWGVRCVLLNARAAVCASGRQDRGVLAWSRESAHLAEAGRRDGQGAGCATGGRTAVGASGTRCASLGILSASRTRWVPVLRRWGAGGGEDEARLVAGATGSHGPSMRRAGTGTSPCAPPRLARVNSTCGKVRSIAAGATPASSAQCAPHCQRGNRARVEAARAARQRKRRSCAFA